MNKEIFIQELRKKLKRLPKEEIENAIGYYVEYFEDAGVDNGQDILKELDSPSVIASQLLSEYAFKNDEITITKPKRSISSIWFIVLAILAAPLALPLAFTLIILVVTMIIVAGAIIFTFIVTTIALIVAGVVTSFAGFAVITQGFSTAIMFIGIGLVLIGVGLLVLVLSSRLVPKIFKGIATLARKLLNRVKKSNKKEEL
ncbi:MULTISPECIES: DUF1700 domain-containing protein [Clostridium]|uniref:DUF1700 domain-containing protein n=1 Tax=Clostridium aquiflavi TaxID=3073603 RepID=A0ABU1EFC9_9CLOT|nr:MULTISPECIES: DUF1700 domain-containing protein [unclassified Clostridium]MDR5587077.1 DUF1700 domain-containing protein [Clostridium sp. 5N-1]NFG61281.1 DUF1700 domain-containing protein [Clostridium botulinum]NFQ09248.1 DUF1700 domain-containing protein [Clostridium botulinum]